MLIPSKYENFSQNILSIGLDVMKILKRKKNIYILYKELLEVRDDEYELPLNKFLLTLDFLYAVGLIHIDEKNLVRLR